MALSYFTYTAHDMEFYKARLAPRLPERIFDAHVHLNLFEHVSAVTAERKLSDWALECGLFASFGDYVHYTKILFPCQNVTALGFPLLIKEALLEENNAYLASLPKNEVKTLMAVCPWHGAEYLEMGLDGGFLGFKPYPDVVSGEKGAELSIFDFMPQWQLKILNSRKKILTLHLPRKGRLPDKANIAELRQIRQDFPDIKIIIAHYGRCFEPLTLGRAIESMGADINGFYYDSAAVLHKGCHSLVFEKINASRILWGSDTPIPLWHGTRKYIGERYVNLPREPFSFRPPGENPDEESYTLFIYEQLDNVLSAIEEGFTDTNAVKNAFFHENTEKLINSII